MNRYRTFNIAALLALGAGLLLSSPTRASQVQWTVHGVSSAGTSLLNVTDAVKLLNGQIASQADVTGHFNDLNFNETNTPHGGLFSGDSAFPAMSLSNQNNYAAEATASVIIPLPGTYTFAVSSDDGFSMTVGSHTMSFPGLRSAGETYASFTFDKAGDYPVDLVYFEHLQKAELELFASIGSYTRFGQTGSDFQLVGDTANGGLELGTTVPAVGNPTPEPMGSVLMLPLVLFLLRRRVQVK